MTDAKNGHQTWTTTRRTALRVGAVAAAATTGLGTAGKALASTVSSDYDVIVVGAGFTGVTAARELIARGHRVLILEARDRIGGRIHTGLMGGTLIEYGGTWIHPNQHNIWSTVEDLGVPLLTDETPSHTVFPAEGGGHEEFTLEEGLGRQIELLHTYLEGVESAFPDPDDPFAAPPEIEALDQRSIQDRLDALGLSELDEAWLNTYTAGQGGTTDRGGFSQIAQWWALSDFDADTFYALNATRPRDGLTDVLQRMVDAMDVDLTLNAPVDNITETNDGVEVVTRDGYAYNASAAVIAVPVNVWNTIDYGRPLPAEFHQAAEDGYSVPGVKKFLVNLAGDLRRPMVNAGPNHLFTFLVPMDTTDEGVLMAGFSTYPEFDTTDHDRIAAAIKEILPDAEVIEIDGHDWGADPQAQGGWTYKQPGQLSEEVRVLRQRQGPLAFATSDISTGWSGYVDGAMESGAHAAREILDFL